MIDIPDINKFLMHNLPILFTDIRLDNHYSLIGVRPSKTAVQYPGQRRFRITRIRTGVRPSITENKTQASKTTRHQHHQKSGDPGGNKIGYIVEPGGRTAKQPVGVTPVTYHI